MVKYIDCEDCGNEQARFTILIGRTGEVEWCMCANCMMKECKRILAELEGYSINYVPTERG